MALPQKVLNLAQFSLEEDVLLAVLRGVFEPEIPVHALIEDATQYPFILVRKNHGMGINNGDPRFFSEGDVSIHTYTGGPDGDQDGGILSEAVRVVLHNAWQNNWHRPDLGSIVRIKMIEEPSRQADWATSSGPVQYADLPNGWYRYETVYNVRVRKPR